MYLNALKAQSGLAILPLSIAATLLYRGDRTIKTWLANGKLAGIRIDDDVYPLASSVLALVNEREAEVDALYKRLTAHAVLGGGILYYSDEMAVFGYDSKLSHDRAHFGYLLGDCSRISAEEMREAGLGKDGFFISSFVWRKPAKGKEPSDIGEGFWNLVESLTGKLIPENERQAFIEHHMKKCVKFYQSKTGK